MINFTGRLFKINFDEKSFKKTLKQTLETQLRQAARAWLRAVIPAVPVYTGMARGTLQPLGRILRVAVPINPVATRKDKSPAAGAAASSFEFSNSDGVFTFTWTNDVLHYYINEYNDMSGILPLRHPTPWHSIEKGNAAFNEYLETNLPKKLPKMGDFFGFDSI